MGNMKYFGLIMSFGWGIQYSVLIVVVMLKPYPVLSHPYSYSFFIMFIVVFRLIRIAMFSFIIMLFSDVRMLE